ncbi:CaiB/BaiF CoA transferase family protein [Kineobactrum salinum]|uniref:CoA transferase n=1 Tax=Kineobactrum salinum TaxID=2708301 RepID=A0A6C0U5K8_9GAMM|nr:CaiB/BaiF CoA-transferase family protein [Kineobactrum salinum]QIB67401.1 CoA transferase [Kineobactrum salinum]
MNGPLKGVRIIEFAGLGPGPFCGMMLADHGAEVIRIDRIGAKGLVVDPHKEILNRSRTSIEVDLKSAKGIDFVRELCKSADGVFEGFRPGVMERLGLGPDVLLDDNPATVYGRMTGWGQDGPYSAMAGHDINYAALSGALHTIGRSDQRPTPPLNMLADFGGGGMMLAFAMLAAILHARESGCGQVVDCAMTEGSAVLMSMIYSLRAEGRWLDERGKNILDSGAHYYDSYETSDGKFIAIGPVEPQFYELLIKTIGLADDVEFQFQNDPHHWPSLKKKLDDCFRSKTRDEWCLLFEGTDACLSPVMSLDEAPHHPHNVARGAFVVVDGIVQPAPAPRYSQTKTHTPQGMRSGIDSITPLLKNVGFDDAMIASLHQEGIIG